MSILELKNVSYRYEKAKKEVLQNISVSFDLGKVYCIIGKSGAGKSTLLSLISGIDSNYSGEILYKEKNLEQINKDDYRAKEIGVIFQSYNLLMHATAKENILLSMAISGVKQDHTTALQTLQQVGIDEDQANRKTNALSGGEQQRVGIARAISHHADLIIADEPTGNLDHETQQDILHIFQRLAKEENKCVILVTHSHKVTTIADTIYRLKQGILQEVVLKK